MKISLNWLSDFLPGQLDAPAFADALTHAGLPVETIDDVVGDTVIDVEVTSNRPDCLSHVGVARELAAILARDFQERRASVQESAEPVSSATQVSIEAPELCPFYTARVLRDVRVQPSPAWMARRLEAIGLRPINNIVDITNYVMYELGQPLHAFDYDKLEGGRIIVRTARAGEKLISIDGHERQLQPDMLVIADAVRPVALAGVMGGRDSEVSDRTVNILLESARFDPLSVRKTARRLAMQSDSSYRFERGIDPTLPGRASLRAAELILDLAGGELLQGVAAAGSDRHEPSGLSLRLSRLQKVLGIEVPAEEAIEALRRLGLAPVLKEDRIAVTVPSWRLDLNIEADLIEEVARIIGYDQVPVRETISIELTPPEPGARSQDLIRSTLVAGGYFESVTFSFVSDALSGDFTPPEAAALARAESTVRKADANLRPSILPGLLESVRHNETVGTPAARLYEIGSTFWHRPDGSIEERRRVGLVGSEELREVRGVIEAMLEKLDAGRAVRVVPGDRPGFAPGACGRIEWGGEAIGHIGRVDAQVCNKFSLRHHPAVAELELVPLLLGAQLVPQLRPLPRFPAVRRDLSLVVSEQTRFEQIETLIREQKLDMLEDLEFVTTYRGKPLDQNQKSVTIALVFRSPSATLTSEQVEDQVQRIVIAARQNLNATLRT
jgi:phenylalanyl-tRNA synthetase beta chain